MSEPINRDEYQNSMARLHERIDGIAGNTIRIEVAAQHITKAVDRIHEAVFGNGKPGALHRITQAWSAINFQWWAIGGVLAIISTMIIMFINHLGG